eukprot:IDg2668t1
MLPKAMGRQNDSYKSTGLVLAFCYSLPTYLTIYGRKPLRMGIRFGIDFLLDVLAAQSR